MPIAQGNYDMKNSVTAVYMKALAEKNLGELVSSSHRPELEGGAWRAVHGAAPGILWTVGSPCLFLRSDHRISRSPLLLLSVSAKRSVVVAIVVVQFLLHVSGSAGAPRSLRL